VTLALSLKVNDGIVLAADSASSLMDNSGNYITNVYFHANKVFNLRKGVGIGCITWGTGGIGQATISTHMKDLRCRFAGEDSTHEDWEIDPNNYQVLDIAEKTRRYLYEELYLPEYTRQPVQSLTGFIVSGYSSGAGLAEEYEITIQNGACAPPVSVRPFDGSGVVWRGQPEAVSRLLLGYGQQLASILETKIGIDPERIASVMQTITDDLSAPMVHPFMPIQDAIDLAEFLVALTTQYTRFLPGAQTVGGAIELATITKHEGFKWINRKHYFEGAFNKDG